MRAGFVTEATREQFRGDDVFGDRATRSLYTKNRPGLTQFSRDPESNEWISLVDLSAIVMNLVKSAKVTSREESPFQWRACLVTTALAVGRGGEVKFQSYDEWMWDPRFELTDTLWTELKKLLKYAMPMVADREDWLIDFYHSHACFWAVEDGLFRSDMNDPTAPFVFPRLHELRDNGVASKLTRVIRKNLPAGMPEELKKQYSIKSTRRGVITELAVHKDIGLFESTGRSGHSTGTTQDSYLDKNSIALGLPAGVVLAHWDNARMQVFPPRLETLGPHAQEHVENLIKFLFVVSIPDFFPGGHLRPVLRTGTASLIMYYVKMRNECGSENVVVDKIRNAAMKAKIRDEMEPTKGPVEVLVSWSEKILKDFRSRNVEIPPATDLASVIRATNAQCILLEGICQRQSNMETKLDALLQQSLRQENKQEEFLNVLRQVLGATGETNRKMSIFRSPPQGRSSPAKRAASPDSSELCAASSGEGPSKRSRLEASNDGLQSQDDDLPAPQQLHYGAAADANNTGAASNKGKTVGGIVEWFHAEGKLKKAEVGFKFESLDRPPFIVTETKKFRDAMELVTEVITEDQLSKLKDRELNREMLLRITAAISMACVGRMKEYEDGEGAMLTKGEINSVSTKATFTALGRRVGAYKKKMEIKTLQQTPGTPEGNTSLRRHFALPPS